VRTTELRLPFTVQKEEKAAGARRREAHDGRMAEE
jgi:hypothetical protein